ncbi:MAG: HlyD family secretion protein [Negativicutes bacterium]|jgi:multidrug resistance efflux pump
MEKVKNKGRLSKLIILALLVVVVLVGLIYGGFKYYDYSHYVSTDDARIEGNITAVGAKVSGKVMKLLVADGDAVKSGQLLLELDPVDLLNQQKQASAAYSAASAKAGVTAEGARRQEIQQAQAGVEAAQAYVEKGTIDFERAEKMLKEGVIPQSQYDAAKANYLTYVSALNYSKAKLSLAQAGARQLEIDAAADLAKQAQGALDSANSGVSYVNVMAPTAGYIGLKAVNIGEVVAAGQPLLYIADLSYVWVKANIEENDLYRLKVGQQVKFTVDAYPGKVFNGKLESILPATQSSFSLIPTENAAGSFTKVTQRVPVKISVPSDSGLVFRPGMSVTVKIAAPN